tara:strand:+ start:284 stop:481 length:198 start_codon:yes stop_codon:yes gene_type:complete
MAKWDLSKLEKKQKEEIDYAIHLLCDVVGSLAIDQFDDQEEYRAVINEIFYEWRIRNVQRTMAEN